MNVRHARFGCRHKFRDCFRQRLRELLANHCSAAEAFGPAWERTLVEVPLSDEDQSVVYRDLIEEVRAGYIFTGPKQGALLEAWRAAIHDF